MSPSPNKFLVTILISMPLLTGCFTSYPEYDEFPDFEKFKELAISGEVVDCDLIASTQIEKQRIYSGMILDYKESFQHDVIDYILHDGYQFEMCPIIQKKMLDYCNQIAQEIVKSSIGRWGSETIWEPKKEHSRLCGENISLALESVRYIYVLPDEETAFLELKTNGVLVNPDTINQLSYGRVGYGLWTLVLHTPKENHVLYFGLKADRDKAKEDIASLLVR